MQNKLRRNVCFCWIIFPPVPILGSKLVACKVHCDKIGKKNTFPLCPNFALNMIGLNLSTNISRGLFFMYWFILEFGNFFSCHSFYNVKVSFYMLIFSIYFLNYYFYFKNKDIIIIFYRFLEWEDIRKTER